jgi:2,4-dienoyl-CoA reductase-like NADH-dependent reductase (Old Yellow Enzyme family)/thioredoxin reductase
MPAMTTAFAGEDGAVTERLVDYFSERAKGGVGLIITDAACIDYPIGKLSHATQLRADYDKFIPGLSDLAKRVHHFDCKIALQLHHAGRQTTMEHTEGRQPVSASEVYDPVFQVKPKALEESEIDEVVKKFGEGARRAQTAAFDAVEIHGAHGYLIQQFLSPYTNRRTDKYGGNLQRRMTFALEILWRVRDIVGGDFPILFRLSAEEHVESGLTIQDTKTIAKTLQEEGVDALHISSGMDETPPEYCDVPPMAVPRGCFVEYASVIKKIVDIPVITVGRINDVTLAEKILQEKKADLIAMGRALITDPELPNKSREGRFDEILKCIACNRCTTFIGAGLHLGCAVNPCVGEEKEGRLVHAAKSKRILVVGAGPAGMEAARILKMRGHEVIICDENDELGGQMNISTKPPHKEELNNLLEFLSGQLRKLSIETVLGKRVDASAVKQFDSDVIILATGATPLIPKIRGINEENVVTAWNVLRGISEVGEEVIVAGGGMVGCETAEFLAEKSKKVVIVEMLDEAGCDMESVTRKIVLKRLAEKNVKILTNTVICDIMDEGILALNKKRNKMEVVKGESIVLALGAKPNDELAKELDGCVKELYLIGDCVKPRRISDAMLEGFDVARQI